MAGIFGRRGVPKIGDGLTVFIYCELGGGRGIPGDGPVIRRWPRYSKKRLLRTASLYQILQVLSVTLFEKTPIIQAFDDDISHTQSTPFSNQMKLLDF